MHRVIHSSAQAAARSASSRRFMASISSRNSVSSMKTKARMPLQQQQKNKSTLAIPPAQEQPVRLTREQISSLFWSAAIPMVGFGFMDNFIMITAGSAIDNSLGVHMGLATMTAAAIGQIVSDVSGVVFGDTLSKWFNVAPANLTKAQSKLRLVSRIKLCGGVLGVTAGCILGAAALWIIPDKDESPTTTLPATSEELQHQRTADQLGRLQKVMTDIMTSQDETWHERRASCTLYVNESMSCCLPSSEDTSKSFFDFGSRESPASIQSLASQSEDPELMHTLKEGRVVVFANTIYMPVQSDADDESSEILGIFKIKLENGSFYNGSEIKDAKKVARNLGFFLNHMVV